jgi:hypothetical protein
MKTSLDLALVKLKAVVSSHMDDERGDRTSENQPGTTSPVIQLTRQVDWILGGLLPEFAVTRSETAIVVFWRCAERIAALGSPPKVKNGANRLEREFPHSTKFLKHESIHS